MSQPRRVVRTGKAKPLGDAIVQARKLAGLAESKLASDIGLTPQHLCRIETGDYVPEPERLVRIARCLDVSAVSLFELAGYGLLAEELRQRENEAQRPNRYIFENKHLTPDEANELLRYLEILRGRFARS